MTNDPFKLAVAQSLSSLAIELNDEISSLQSQQIRLSCLNTRVQLTNLRATQFIEPSAVLSTVLNRPAFATIGTSTLQELSCVNVSGTLSNSLRVGKRFAARPIMHIEFNNVTTVAQWTRGKYLRYGIKDFMPVNGATAIFQIQNRPFVFRNGLLVEENVPVIQTVGLNQKTTPIPHTSVDPTVLVERFSTSPSPIGLDYLQQTLETLALLNSAQLSAHGIDEEDLANFANNPFDSLAHSTFLQSITDKIIAAPTLLHNLYHWSTVFWVTIANAFLLYSIIATVTRAIRAAKQGPPDTEVNC